VKGPGTIKEEIKRLLFNELMSSAMLLLYELRIAFIETFIVGKYNIREHTDQLLNAL